MLTKQQLDDVYKEVQELQSVWEKERKKDFTKTKYTEITKYMVSHRLLGLFLINFNSNDKKELK